MASKKERYLLRQLKGLNQAQPQNISDTQFQSLENFFARSGILEQRNGLARITTSAYGSALTSLFAYKTSAGVWTLIATTATEILKQSGGGLVLIPRTGGGSYASSTLPWSIRQYKDIFYLARDAAGSLQRSDGSTADVAGIAAPSAAPTIAQGAAGDIGAGTYRGVYTFYNSVTGAEGNFSPVSSALVLGASRRIDWSAILTSSNGQVNARRLYRTLANSQGEYFRVATITDNTSTTYTDNTADADVGSAGSINNGIPPAALDFIEIFQERMWASDGVDVFYSELGLPESWGEFSSVPVAPDDGYRVSGLMAYGERLLITKTKGIYYLTGTDENSFQLRLLEGRHGCMSHHSLAQAEGLAFWFGGDNFYMTDGNQVKAFGDVHVRTMVNSITAANYNRVIGAVDASRGWYIAGVPASGSSVVNRILIYDFKNDSWAIFTYAAGVGAPVAFGDFADASEKRVLYCATSAVTGIVFEFNSGNSDDGSDIAYLARTKSFGFAPEDSMKAVLTAEVLISTTTPVADLQCVLRRDDQAAAQSTISVSTEGQYMWKRFGVSNIRNPGNYHDVELSYSGQARFNIAGIGLTVVDLKRIAPHLAAV